MEFAVFAATGLLLGFGVNYLADVLPATRSLSHPLCKACSAEIPWGTYLVGRACPACGTRPGWRWWAVWLFTLGIIAFLWIYPQNHSARWIGLALAGYFGLVAVIDLEHRLVLHPVSLAGAGLGLVVGWLLHGFLPTLLGGVAGFAIMLGLYALGGVFAKWMAKRRGEPIEEVALGFGDVNLAGVCGLMLGWPGITAGLVIGILLGGGVSLAIILGQLAAKKYKPFTAIPYAPFIILGTIILLLRTINK